MVGEKGSQDAGTFELKLLSQTSEIPTSEYKQNAQWIWVFQRKAQWMSRLYRQLVCNKYGDYYWSKGSVVPHRDPISHWKHNRSPLIMPLSFFFTGLSTIYIKFLQLSLSSITQGTSVLVCRILKSYYYRLSLLVIFISQCVLWRERLQVIFWIFATAPVHLGEKINVILDCHSS